MRKKLQRNVDVLDPEFRKQFENVVSDVNVSISKLYEAATLDRKTGVYNYNFFKTVFEMEFEKAKRGFQRLSFFILDIDYFKKINDTYGHAKADDMLEELAKVLKKNTRHSDIVARFGGEEFVILLPETDIHTAKEVTARIKDRIQKNSFLKKYNLTISGGLTSYQKRDTLKKMLERADNALYEAKNTGRDKLVVISSKLKGEFSLEDTISKKRLKKIKKLKKSSALREFKRIFK